MNKIKNNKYMNNCAALKILTSGRTNDVECQCLLCGGTDTYKKSDLTSGKLLICKKCKGKVELNKDIPNSDLIAVAYKRLLGTQVVEGSNISGDDIDFFNYGCGDPRPKVVCQCKKNKQHRVDYYLYQVNAAIDAGISIPCSQCEEEKKQLKIQKEQAKIEKNNDKASIKHYGANPFTKESKRTGALTLETDANIQDKPARSNKLANGFMIGDLINNWIVSNIENESRETSISERTGNVRTTIDTNIYLTCIKCGYTIKINANKATREDISLRKCKSCLYNSNKANDINIFNNVDYVGTVKNDLIVDSVHTDKNGVKYVKAHCMICAKHFKDKKKQIFKIPLYEWEFTSTFRCPNCCNEKINVICPSCGKPHFKITRNNLYNESANRSTFGRCPFDNKNISLAELALYHRELRNIQSCKDIYDDNFETDRTRESSKHVKLLMFKDKYTGTDNQEYFSCLCIKHHKLLSLTNNEIIEYNHEYCSNPLMTAYSSSKKGIYNRKLE